MIFSEFREQRLAELKEEDRVAGGNDPGFKGLNKIHGLLDLIAYCKPKTVLEIGSHLGVSTECFLLNCSKVVVIDPWTYDPFFDGFMVRCGAYPHLKVYRDISDRALQYFPPASFDMVYVDGLHDYFSVKKDIEGSLPLVKSGGWLAGHDYVKFSVATEVPKVVVELFGREPDKVFDDTSWIIKADG